MVTYESSKYRVNINFAGIVSIKIPFQKQFYRIRSKNDSNLDSERVLIFCQITLVLALEEFNAVGLQSGSSAEIEVISGDKIHRFTASCVEMSGIFVLVDVYRYQNSFVLGTSLEDALSVCKDYGPEIAVI